MVAIVLHWVMAAGIFALAVMGLIMVHGELEPARTFQIYQLHKSIGITVLLAAVLRLSWRLSHRPPDLPQEMPALEIAAARGSHGLLYLLLFAQPVTGWALVSASVLAIPTVLFGIVPWPHLPYLPTLSNKAEIEYGLKQVHAYGAYLFLTIITVHVAAALRHHFIIGDDILLRMLPRRRGLRVKPSLKEETN